MDTQHAKGYTLTINAGLRRAYEQGFKVFVCLNSDTVVTHMWLEHLRAALHAYPKAGMAGEASYGDSDS